MGGWNLDGLEFGISYYEHKLERTRQQMVRTRNNLKRRQADGWKKKNRENQIIAFERAMMRLESRIALARGQFCRQAAQAKVGISLVAKPGNGIFPRSTKAVVKSVTVKNGEVALDVAVYHQSQSGMCPQFKVYTLAEYSRLFEETGFQSPLATLGSFPGFYS